MILLYNFFKLYWIKLSAKGKLIFIGFSLMSLALLYVCGKSAYYKYQYFKSLEKEKKEWVKKNELSSKKIDSLIVSNLKILEKYKSKSDEIDLKRKRDEEIINSKPVSDAELDEFLSRFDN